MSFNDLIGKSVGANAPTPSAPATPTSNGNFSSFINGVVKSTPGPTGLESATITDRVIHMPNIDRYDKGIFIGGDYNMEDMYGKNQSTLSKWGNAVVKMGALATTTFLEGTVGLVYGVGSAISDGKFSSFHDNPFLNSINEFNKGLEDSFANYYTDAEKNAAWWSPGTWATANFWSDTVLKNMGFVVGAYMSGGAWTKAFSALSKTLGVSTRASAAAASRMSSADELLHASTGNVQSINTARSLATSETARVAKTVYGENVAKSVIAAAGEASIEASHAVSDFKEKMINSFQERYGYTPEGEELRDIEQTAANIGNTVFGANMAVLTASNLVMFPKLAGSKFDPNVRSVVSAGERRAGMTVVTDASGKVIRRPFSGVGVANLANGERLVASRATTKIGNQMERFAVGRLMNRVSPWAKMVFAPSEMLEEASQTFIPMAAEAYWDKGSDTHRDILASLSKSVDDTVLNVNNKDFWVAALSGGLSGGIMTNSGVMGGRFGESVRSHRESVRHNQTVANAINEASPDLNEMSNIIGSNNRVGDRSLENLANTVAGLRDASHLSTLSASVARDAVLQEEAYNALMSNDRLQYEDNRTDAMLNYLMPRVQYGRASLVHRELDGWREAASTESGFEELQKSGVINEEVSREDFLSGIERMSSMAEEMSSLFDGYNVRYGNVRDADGKPVYTKDVLMQMAYIGSKIYDYNRRIPTLVDNLSKKGVLVSELLSLIERADFIDESDSRIDPSTGDEYVGDRTEGSDRKQLSDDIHSFINQTAEDMLRAGKSADDIDQMMVEVSDIMELSSRRKFKQQEYDFIHKNASLFDRTEKLKRPEPDSRMSRVSIPTTVKERFFAKNQSKMFTLNRGKRGSLEGTLEYGKGADTLAMRLPDGSLYEVTVQDFNNGTITSSDGTAIYDDEFTSHNDARVPIKRANTIRQMESVVNEVLNDHTAAEKMLAEVERNISALSEHIKSMSSVSTMSSALTTMINQRDALEKERDRLTAEVMRLEDVFDTYVDLLNSTDIIDYNYALNELEDAISTVTDAMNLNDKRFSRVNRMIDKVDTFLKQSAKVIGLSYKLNPSNAATMEGQTIIRIADELTLAENPEDVRDATIRLIDALSAFSDASDTIKALASVVKISDAQKSNLQSRLDSINDEASQLNRDYESMQELYDRLLGYARTLSMPIPPGRFISTVTVEDMEYMAGLETYASEVSSMNDTSEDSESVSGEDGGEETEGVTEEDSDDEDTEHVASRGTDDGDTDVISLPKSIYRGAKKTLARLFTSTKAMDNNNQNLNWYKDFQDGVNKMRALPSDERDRMRVRLVTYRNESSEGLDGLVARVYRDSNGMPYYKNPSKMVEPRDGAIAAVVCRENEDGTYSYLDKDLIPTTDVKKVLVSKLPAATLLDRTGGQAYVRPETVSVTPEQYLSRFLEERTSILNSDVADRVYPFTISRGNPGVSNTSEYDVVGNLINISDINNDGLLTIVLNGETFEDREGVKITAKGGKLIILNTVDTQVALKPSMIGHRRAKMLARAVMMTVQNSVGYDSELVKFLAMTLPPGHTFSKDFKSLLNSKGKVVEDLSVFATDSDLESRLIKYFENKFSRVAHDLRSPFTEFEMLDDGSIVENKYSTYQEYLLSNRNGRKPILVSNYAPNSRTNRYLVLNGFMSEHTVTNPTTSTTNPTPPTSGSGSSTTSSTSSKVTKNNFDFSEEIANFVTSSDGTVSNKEVREFADRLTNDRSLLEDLMESLGLIYKHDC